MSGIGHNKGPTMEPGYAYRLYQWKRARTALIPKSMPLEIVRMRVKRAKELGLPYKTYASFRAASGHDIVAFLFSSNALRIDTGTLHIPNECGKILDKLKSCGRMALVYKPLVPEQILAKNKPLDHVGLAPAFTDSWSDMRNNLKVQLSARGLRGDQVIVIGQTAMEREWCGAAKSAGYLTGDRYFNLNPLNT